MNKYTEQLNEQRDILVALLRGTSGSMSISDIWRGVQNRGIAIGYNELEDWVLDQTDLFQVSPQGNITIHPSVDVTQIRRTRIVPELDEEGDNVDGTTRLHRLIAYYRDCLREEGKSIAAYRNQENSSFVVMDQELHSSGKNFASVKTSQAGDFVKNVSGNKRAAFYGYPLVLDWIETGDGEFADYKIIPVFITRLDLQEEPERCIFHLDKHTRLNPLLLTKTRWKDRSFIQAKLDAEQEHYSSFEERLAMFQSVFQGYESRETLDPQAIFRAADMSLIPKEEGGIYNRCGVFLGGANPYFVGLIRDLENLLDKAGSQFERTALAPLLRTATENKKLNPTRETVRVFNPSKGETFLNASQESAALQAFNNTLSVITGPPGTGKSQVVTAAIATAVLHNKTVLFASRNNKALEVVQERIKEICPDLHALIRVGGTYDDQCKEILDRMEALPALDNSIPFAKQMENIDLHLVELNKFEAVLAKTASIINESVLAEDRFNILKKEYLPGNINAYEIMKGFNASSLLTVVRRFKALLQKTERWPLFITNLIIQFQKKNGKKEIEKLNEDLKMPEIQLSLTWPDNRASLTSSFKKLFPLIDFVKAAKDMQTTAENLGEADELSAIHEEIIKHRKAVAKKLPPLYLAKIRENASGKDMPEETQDALLQYRDTMPQLRGTRLNDKQRRVRLAALGNVFPNILKRLPAWAVTNLSISHRIPLEAALFDLVIIDEASQCDIPSSLPLLYRAKQAVIIGDPLQLPQITSLSPRVDDQIARQHQMDGPENDHLRYTEKSLYNAARRVAPSQAYQFLANHYRCHPDIINFANSVHWYEDRLEVFTDIEKLNRPDFWEKGISWVQVTSHAESLSTKGYYLPEEVDKVIELIKDLLETKKFGGSVGVVCPFRAMIDLIRDGVDKAVHPQLLQAVNFDAQTAHGFQGDERDVIIYAMAVHSKMPRGSKWFVAQNSNLFNVALSRARAAFVVIGDKEAVREITFENRPVDYLRDLVFYTEKLGQEKSTETGEPKFGPEQIWEERFYNQALQPAGITVRSQYPLGPYKLDFAVIQKNRKLDIEIDGEAYHKDAAGRRLRRDIDRDIYVKAQDGGAWDVMRFWVYELREDMEACLKKIQQWMNSTK